MPLGIGESASCSVGGVVGQSSTDLLWNNDAGAAVGNHPWSVPGEGGNNLQEHRAGQEVQTVVVAVLVSTLQGVGRTPLMQADDLIAESFRILRTVEQLQISSPVTDAGAEGVDRHGRAALGASRLVPEGGLVGRVRDGVGVSMQVPAVERSLYLGRLEVHRERDGSVDGTVRRSVGHVAVGTTVAIVGVGLGGGVHGHIVVTSQVTAWAESASGHEHESENEWCTRHLALLGQ